MREKHSLDGGAGNREIAVQPLGLLTAALKHAAIEQVVLAIDFEPVHRAGDASGGALKRVDSFPVRIS
jgi:hypothetical protein